MSQNSYLREFCAQVSKIVFQADLAFLLLSTTVWAEMPLDSYLHDIFAQVSKNHVLSWLDRFTAY